MKKTVKLTEDFEWEDVAVVEIEESDIEKFKEELSELRKKEDDYYWENIKKIIDKYCSNYIEIEEIPVIYF